MGGGTDYAQEAIGELLSISEEKRYTLVIILAGYEKEMKQLLAQNQGLSSRFPIQIDFPNYTPDQLFEVAQRMVKTREEKLSEEAEKLLKEQKLADELPGNARDVRNMIEGAAKSRDTRIAPITEPTREDLTTFTAADFDTF